MERGMAHCGEGGLPTVVRGNGPPWSGEMAQLGEGGCRGDERAQHVEGGCKGPPWWDARKHAIMRAGSVSM